MEALRRYRSLILAGLVIAAVIAAGSAWLASSEPDGLERVAEDKGFIDEAKDPRFEFLPDYTIPGIEGAISTVIAGVVGVVVVAALTFGVGHLLRSRRAADPAAATHPPPPAGGRGS